MNKYYLGIISIIALILLRTSLSLKISALTQSDLMKLKSIVGRGLLPQIKQTLLTNTTQSLEKHINNFMNQTINKQMISANTTYYNTTTKNNNKAIKAKSSMKETIININVPISNPPSKLNNSNE